MKPLLKLTSPPTPFPQQKTGHAKKMGLEIQFQQVFQQSITFFVGQLWFFYVSGFLKNLLKSDLNN